MPEPEPAPENSTLLKFQEAFLELLASGEPYEQILKTLTTDPRFENYQDYIQGFDPDMVDVASELMWKWAKRKPEAD